MKYWGGGEKKKEIRLLDVAILLHHMHKANRDSTIGFADINDTSETLTRALNATMPIEQSRVESLLWSSGLLEEQGGWWHPYHESFDTWVKSMLGGERVSRIYYTINKKIEEENDD